MNIHVDNAHIQNLNMCCGNQEEANVAYESLFHTAGPLHNILVYQSAVEVLKLATSKRRKPKKSEINKIFDSVTERIGFGGANEEFVPSKTNEEISNDLSNIIKRHANASAGETMNNVFEDHVILNHYNQAKAKYPGDQNALRTLTVAASVAHYGAKLYTKKNMDKLVDEGGNGTTVIYEAIDWGEVMDADTKGTINGGVKEGARASLYELVDQLVDEMFDS